MSFDKQKCNFLSFGKTTCSSDLRAVENFSLEEQTKFLSACGVIPVSSCGLYKYICTNHVKSFNALYKQRLESRRCSAPPLISCHTGNCKAERHLSLEQITTVFQRTGIVLPIGMGICAQCRKNMLQRRTDDPPVKDKTNYAPGIEEELVPKKRRTIIQKRDDIDTDQNETSAKANEMDTDNTDYNFSQDSQNSIEHLSQSSVTSYIRSSRLESLNSFLSVCGLSPVKEIQNSFTESSERTRHRYETKALQCVNVLLDTICPNEGDALWKNISASTCSDNNDSCNPNVLKEIYLNADTWQFRKQILSILTQQISCNEAQKLIPGLTSWKYYEAKRHAADVGVGQPVPSIQLHREKIKTENLEHFIDFITSSHVIKDIPFGQKTLKMGSGEIVPIPNVVRSLSSSSLINQYIQLCEEEDITPLGKSTLYKILHDCPASVRKSIEGLDNYVMEGSRAFQTLEEILSAWKEDELINKLTEVKRYLKTDFKVHLNVDTEVQDHCMVYALSSSKEEFKGVCCQKHTKRCPSCIEIDAVLDNIKILAYSKEIEKKDSIQFKVDKAIQDIKDLQKHIVRSRNQERARPAIVDSMECGDVIITCDWAMKFLPRKYREGQMDWFAKRGINWHVSVSLIKMNDSYKTLTHIHIFNGQTPQDAPYTTAVICDVVNNLRETIPNINKVHFFSDNAGCYKNSSSLVTLRGELGEQLASYNFSEVQNGKGPCDRRASHAKKAISRYVNEGRDVTTAEEMKMALDKVPSTIKVKVVDGVYDLDREKQKVSIQNITNYFNFCYETEGLRIWQAFGIGEGKLIKWTELKPDKNHVQLKSITEWTELADVSDLNGRQKHERTVTHFFCPKDGCVKEFQNQTSLDNHVLLGDCDLKQETLALSERVKETYAKKLSENESGNTITLSTNYTSDDVCKLPLGWAFKAKKAKTLFSEKQKKFMREKFEVGKRGGCKVDPYVAADEMQKNGQFGKSEFLTGQQITSFFSRLSQQEKKMDKQDYRAAEHEENKHQLMEEILKTI